MKWLKPTVDVPCTHEGGSPSSDPKTYNILGFLVCIWYSHQLSISEMYQKSYRTVASPDPEASWEPSWLNDAFMSASAWPGMDEEHRVTARTRNTACRLHWRLLFEIKHSWYSGIWSWSMLHHAFAHLWFVSNFDSLFRGESVTLKSECFLQRIRDLIFADMKLVFLCRVQ